MAFMGTFGPQASTSAFAQVSGLEEVVVTAQRREQSIMEVPIAVTLVSGQELEKVQLRNQP
jgi:iron complex outermembrane receptor protein